MTLYYALPEQLQQPFWRRCLSFGSVAGLHGMGLLLAFGLAVRPDLIQPLQALTVRMLEIAPTPAKVELPKPKPVVPPPRKATPPPLAPPTIMTASTTVAAVSSFVVAPPPEARPVDSRPPPPAPIVVAPIVAARFDAGYLQNPKPVYPTLSRRLGEEGKVVLRVRVSAQGASLNVEIKQSSAYLRLDEAARAAVEQWRFVPARQGSEAIESTVLVPLHFALES